MEKGEGRLEVWKALTRFPVVIWRVRPLVLKLEGKLDVWYEKSP